MSASKRRAYHLQRIAAERRPVGALALAWAWVLAEVRKQPHLLTEVHGRVVDLATELNGRSEA